MDDAEVARYMALGQISHIDRHGIVDGVEIDLRHELLNPPKWETKLIGDGLSLFRRSYEPFIWFPWFGSFNKEAIRAKIVAEKSAHSSKPLSKSSIDYVVRQFTPECFVYSGDKILIDKVDSVKIGDNFDHADDAEIRYAQLQILRANGKVEKVRKPLLFTGIASISAPGTRHDVFDKIFYRAREQFKIKDFIDVESLYGKNKYAYEALNWAFLINARTFLIRERAEDFKSPEHAEAFTTWSLVNDATLMGYYWAKAEAELGMRPFAESALRSKLAGSIGGNKSGITRRSKRAKTWEPHARELAKSIRGNNPSFSQDNVATEIVTRWKLNSDPPGHKTLKDLVSKMEKNEEIPARKAH